jgi:hypothetical protein
MLGFLLHQLQQLRPSSAVDRLGQASAGELTGPTDHDLAHLGHKQPLAVQAEPTTRRCTSLPLILSPAAWDSSRNRTQSLNTTRAQPNTRARTACCPGEG